MYQPRSRWRVALAVGSLLGALAYFDPGNFSTYATIVAVGAFVAGLFERVPAAVVEYVQLGLIAALIISDCMKGRYYMAAFGGVVLLLGMGLVTFRRWRARQRERRQKRGEWSPQASRA